MDLDSDEFYENVYEYAFKKLGDVWLTAENSWSSTGIWFIVYARTSENSLDESLCGGSLVWWEEDHHLLPVEYKCSLK